MTNETGDSITQVGLNRIFYGTRYLQNKLSFSNSGGRDQIDPLNTHLTVDCTHDQLSDLIELESGVAVDGFELRSRYDEFSSELEIKVGS